MKKQVSIIGAGLAGLTAAELLVKAGFSVTLFDPKVPWEKPCGGLLSRKVVDEFPFLEQFSTRYKTRCDGIWFESPTGEKTYRSFEEPVFAISRLQLGQYLLEKAIKAGARLVPECVRTITRDPDSFFIRTSDDTHRCELLIGADGANSLVRRILLEKIPKEDMGVTCGYNITGMQDQKFIIKYLDIDGYIWVFPGPTHTNAGIGTRVGTKTTKAIREQLDNYLEQNIDYERKIGTWGSLVPFIKTPGFFSKPCSGKNWILVGDAAGHVDPVTAEGIYYALKSGELAAQALIKNNIPLYDLIWQKTYGKLLESSANHMKNIAELGESMEGQIIGTIMYNNSVFTQQH